MKTLVLAASLVLLAAPALAQQPVGGRIVQEPDHLIAGKPELAPTVREFVRSLNEPADQSPAPDAKLRPANPDLPFCPPEASKEYAQVHKCQPLSGVMGGRRGSLLTSPPEPAPQQ